MRLQILALAAAAALLSAGLAHAGEVKGTNTYYYTYLPTLLPEGENQYYTVGQARGITMNEDGTNIGTLCTGWSAPDGGAGGHCVNYDVNGDRYWIEYECNQPIMPPPAGSILACNGTAKAIAGTGKYANIKGTNTHVQYVTGILPDGTVVGYTVVKADFSY